MTTERYERGLAARKAVLGGEYVERSLADADDFNQGFQDLLTEFAWGTTWANDTLTFRERSLVNLGMIAALNRMEEFELHFRAAIRNGLSKAELETILHQIAIYAGMPAGVSCFRVANKVFAELASEPTT
jgi:4-carboxymuconolactone decarboxylase